MFALAASPRNPRVQPRASIDLRTRRIIPSTIPIRGGLRRADRAASLRAPRAAERDPTQPETPPPGPGAPFAPEDPASGGKALAGAGFALGVALFAATSLGGAPTLASLERDAIPLDAALANGRPTVVEFYADWCEVCKESAPNVYDVEREFGERVNFVMLNIDNTKWGGEMDQYGVDGIPHIVFLDKRGKSEGQVVGRFPKQALRANVQALSVGETKLPFAKLEDGWRRRCRAPAWRTRRGARWTIRGAARCRRRTRGSTGDWSVMEDPKSRGNRDARRESLLRENS